MQTTNINWTDKVWNPVTGCSKVSAGCKNCYAEIMFNRQSAMDYNGNVYQNREFIEVQCHQERMHQPLRFKKPKKIFVNSMSDLFHPKVPYEFIDNIFEVIRYCPQHTFQILTKRPERMIEYFKWTYIQYPQVCNNVWLGVSIEDQKTADERIPLLLQTPAEVRWLSIEPLLELVNIDPVQLSDNKMRGRHTIDWVVIGCESGPKRRECETEWISKIVWQCQQEKIPVWVKQININGKIVEDVKQFPKPLQVRQLPEDSRC